MSTMGMRFPFGRWLPAALRTRYATPIGRIWSFCRNYYVLFNDASRQGRLKMVGVVGLDGIGALCRGGVIGVVAYFVSIAETGSALEIPRWDVSLESPTSQVAVLALCVFALSALGAYSVYKSALVSRGLARAFYSKLSDAVLCSFLAWRPEAPSGEELTRQRLIMQITRNALHASLSVETVLKILQPVLYMLTASLMLFLLDPVLSIVVLPIIGLLGPLVYKLADQTRASAHSFYHSQASKMGQTVNGLITEIDASGALDAVRRDYTGTYERVPALVDYLDGFDGNQLANDRMGLVLAGVRAVALTGAIVLFGTLAIGGQRSWAEAVAFVGALLYLLNSAQTFLAYISTLSRFYPQVVDFADVASRTSGAIVGVGGNAVSPTVEIRVEPGPIIELSLARGTCLGFWSPHDVSRITLMNFLEPLVAGSPAGGEMLRGATFLSAHHRFVTGRVIDNLSAGVDLDAAVRRLEAVWEQFGGSVTAASLRKNLETDVADDAWSTAGEAVRALASLLQLLWTSETVVIIDAPLLRRLADTDRQAVLRLLADRIVIVALDGGGLPCECVAYAVSEEGRTLTGCGDLSWFTAVRSRLRKRSSRSGGVALDEVTLGA